MSRLLTDPDLFAKLIICLYFLSMVRYGYQGDWGRTMYWGAAALITISVTFLIKH